MQNSDSLKLATPVLPSGGGAIVGLKGDIATAGPDGAAKLVIPLPVSTGRGYAPPLSLSYHSRSGNGPFGMGWSIGMPVVQLRTCKGVPQFDGTDEFTGPDGEVLVPVLDNVGKPENRNASTLLGELVGGNFTVQAYRYRTETDFSRLEYWRQEGGDTDFWVLYPPDGQVHLLGHSTGTRISNPQNPAQTAVWLLESSVSATGEQIYYQYRAESDDGCSDEEKSSHPADSAQRYLAAVWYGNRKAGRTLPSLTGEPVAADWLFTLVCDYGERSTDAGTPPGWLAPGSGNRPCRADAFSSREYGFELRTRRLCRQVLMYHAVTALAGEEKTDDVPQLVSRLLLTYNEDSSMSTLQTLQQVAYEHDGTPRMLPPLSFSWQTFTPPAAGRVTWQERDDMGRLSPQQPYQLVDLNGEGIAGILYQDAGSWCYRSPERHAGDDVDAITWDKGVALPSLPALSEGGVLADTDGDGYPEWVVAYPGMAGRYKRTPEGQWRSFIPLSALPVEYAHSNVMLTDLSGDGLADLVLIGPKSIRLYSGTGDGWTQVRTVMQAKGTTLPVPGIDARVMVAFSDIVGSGLQHLVEVRASGVRYWPNAGHGRFDAPVSIPGFSVPAATFNPAQLFLADIDGSGTVDMIYAMNDHLLVWLNQSGNRFAKPFRIDLPDDVRFDRACSLQVADIQGLGVASLMLAVPHPTPRHWVCHLTESKPWLLIGMNNNMGAIHTLFYRSSAQFWLDEKAAATVAGKIAPVSRLPFVLQTLQRTEVTDEITANRLVSTVRYRHGVWDGCEREFRGFGFVEVSDTDAVASEGNSGLITLPAVSRHWYATGVPEVDLGLPSEYWPGDTAAFSHYIPRFTTGSGESEQTYEPDKATAFWLNRGLKGLLLRTELYGADKSSQEGVPYTVTETRPQVRLVEKAETYPVIWSSVVESRSYVYERVSSDPQCSQQVRLTSDEFGLPLRQVSISYPRRQQPDISPYPVTLPDGLFAASFDGQQKALHLMLTQHGWHGLSDVVKGSFVTGLPDASRSDVFTLPASTVPATGLTLESLLKKDGPLSQASASVFAGQSRSWYLDDGGNETTDTPAFPPRQAFTEAAMLNESMATALAQDVTAAQLVQPGYLQTDLLFPRADEEGRKIWSVRQGYVTYRSGEHFWQPVTYRATLLTGAVSVTRDACDCVVTKQQDAAGQTVSAEYDWRFLTPTRVTDANDNIHTATADALGRITMMRFYGTEKGQLAGYSNGAFSVPGSAEIALALKSPLSVAQCVVYVPDSWMYTGTDKLPPHLVILTTDRYDADPEQQIRQQVTFFDGFGRTLQQAARQTNGEAWQRSPDGALVTSSDGVPVTIESDFRWAVSGRKEYDNKGQIVRNYQPYFLDDWKYVRDDSARQDLNASTHYYDPAGREWQVKTAKGWLRRSLYTPWFIVSEDENDTQEQVN